MTNETSDVVVVDDNDVDDDDDDDDDDDVCFVVVSCVWSRDAGDRSRDRDRERQRQARAQMSSQVAEPEEFMPLFDAPVRVSCLSLSLSLFSSLDLVEHHSGHTHRWTWSSIAAVTLIVGRGRA